MPSRCRWPTGRSSSSLRDRVRFGVGAIEIARRAGRGDRRAGASSSPTRASSPPASSRPSSAALDGRGVEHARFTEVEPNPGATSSSAAARRSRAFGLDGTVVVAGRRRLGDGHGQGASSLHADERAAASWDLGYDEPDLTPGPARDRRR